MVPEKHVKCVVVGDGAVGKTCMLYSYTENKFPTDYIPTVFDNYSADVPVNGKLINVGFWDTAGQDDYERMRPLSYKDANVVVLAFSLIARPSFDNISTKWTSELKEWLPQAPIVLVGTKLDLRGDLEFLRSRAVGSIVQRAEGEAVGARIGARAYLECSAKTQENLKQVFDAAIIAALRGPVLEKKLRKDDKGLFRKFKSFFRK
mmetsp:Transcript_1505/g.2159  ORF Transcript_1505/g.2159 Transcript_1505/m.2159 type:complete len:205 (+) Transcript_1505:38-652(+)|eukprot:CAMPEP_0196595178 /NCGR_PEP_ID=MMETSP1081-20130531/80406_1 /TAXON_ID=36882 /ORGANISM="Pyramimonas amylifera, Strain CCMP720" /LENGTH=204 /DNA_ID=CAMNT_0041919675 /DNA_START=33 /DNA_END=647 /DNA_ORIENTATION=-